MNILYPLLFDLLVLVAVVYLLYLLWKHFRTHKKQADLQKKLDELQVENEVINLKEDVLKQEEIIRARTKRIEKNKNGECNKGNDIASSE